jgi:predicted Zn-dependent peptidase
MQTVKLDERLYRTSGDNGVTVVSEVLPGVRSVAVGIWVRAASVHEERAQMGLSHLWSTWCSRAPSGAARAT